MSDDLSSVSNFNSKLSNISIPDLPVFSPKDFGKKHIPYNGINFIRAVFVGATQSGKNVAFKSMYHLWFKGQYDYYLIFTGTASKGNFDYLDPNKTEIYDDFSFSALKAIMNVNQRRQYNKEPTIRTMIIFDDVLDDTNKNLGIMHQLFKKGRNWDLSVVALIQDFKQMVPACLGQVNMWVFRNVVNEKRCKEVIDYFSSLSDRRVIGDYKNTVPFWLELIYRYSVDKDYGSLIIFTNHVGENDKFKFSNAVFQYTADKKYK